VAIKTRGRVARTFRPLNVVLAKGSRAERTFRRTAGLPAGLRRVPADLASGFTPTPKEDLVFHGGKTVQNLTYTNFYIGGAGSWVGTDRANIDHALSAAMSDVHLNNVIRQYFNNAQVTATFQPSRILSTVPGPKFSQGDVVALINFLMADGSLKGFDLTSTLFNVILPRGTVLTTSPKPTSGTTAPKKSAKRVENPARPEDQVSSLQGLGGYHGSVHLAKAKATVYYAVGVFSEGNNGIVAFDHPWKNVVATFYHELQEARTDMDVADAIKAGNSPKAAKFLGWMAQSGNEIGDFPISEAGPDLSKVMKEVPLANGSGTVPIQLMYSNFVHGPEGPIPNPHPVPASKTFTLSK
jgi:hypothetical protein